VVIFAPGLVLTVLLLVANYWTVEVILWLYESTVQFAMCIVQTVPPV